MITNGILLVLATMGLFLGAFLSVYLVMLKSGHHKANLFLGLALLGLTIRIGKSVINYYISLEAWQRNIGIAGILLTGPFLWFYGIIILDKTKDLTKRRYFHIVPFLLFILFLAVIPSNGSFELYWNYGIVVCHLAIYLILSWKLWYRNRFDTSKSLLRWYRNILIGASVIWGFYFANFLSLDLFYITGPIFYTFMIYAFLLLFLQRHKFHLEKYSGSKLTRDSSENLFIKIKGLFEQESMYLDSYTTLNTVAEKLETSPRLISQAINENEQQNFNEFVNRYRIEKAKKLMATPKYKNEKMASVAYDSGFGNITSFNLAFKKSTGITPSAYRKQHCRS